MQFCISFFGFFNININHKKRNKTQYIKTKTLFISYRNRSTKEPTFERPFHNPAYNDYEMPVKTHADKGDGYEELPVDKKDENAYNIYLSIKE